MSTLFNSSFSYYEVTAPGYDSEGDPTEGAKTVKTVRGTIQPVSASQTATLQEGGDRQTGTVKVYSSERLAIRSQDNSAIGYVKSAAGIWYELTAEDPNQNGLIPHYKYLGSEIPAAQVPEVLK